MNIIPYNDNLLVELQSTYKKALTTETRVAETYSKGVCVAVSEEYSAHKLLVGKLLYFDEWEDTTNYKQDGKKYALIPVSHIRGYEK
jgi:co-chaperonin GroES (HSP10)